MGFVRVFQIVLVMKLWENTVNATRTFAKRNLLSLILFTSPRTALYFFGNCPRCMLGALSCRVRPFSTFVNHVCLAHCMLGPCAYTGRHLE